MLLYGISFLKKDKEDIKMYSFMYEKVNKDNKARKDTKFTMIITIIIVISLFVIGSFVWSFGFRYRFSHFLEKFAECNSYSEKEDSLTVEMDGKIYKVTDDNRQGIFNYIVLNNSGKESKKLPEEEPIILDYGNGAVIKLWKVPPDKYTNSSGLFLHYEDTDGNSYSYINYKMTLETIITRYLLYDNIDLTRDKTDTEEILVSENNIKKDDVKESEVENEVEEIEIVEGTVPIQDIDWDAYQDIMNAEEYETLLEYMPVLKNESKFTWEDYNPEKEHSVVSIDEFRDIFERYDAGRSELLVYYIAISDIDEDGIKELILFLHNGMGTNLILHKENEEFYGIDKCLRCFGDLQINGIYTGSAGAHSIYYHKMKFADGKFEENILAHTDYSAVKQDTIYFIGDDEVSQDVFYEWEESVSSEEVTCYDAVRKE